MGGLPGYRRALGSLLAAAGVAGLAWGWPLVAQEAPVGGEAASGRPMEERSRAGGTPEAARAVERGLAYLARQQSPTTGSTGGSPYTEATTSLAGLAFLAGGAGFIRGAPIAHPGRPDGETSDGEVVAGCLRYVVGITDEETGFVSAGERGEDRPGRMHAHGYATLFMAESYGNVPTRLQPRLAGRLRAAVQLILDSQTERGGWGYRNAADRGFRRETADDEGSVTVTMVQALRAARDAGVDVPAERIEAALDYLRRSCVRTEGAFRYSLSMGVDRTSYELTAAAVSTLNAAGVYESEELRLGLRYLLGALRRVENPWRAAATFEWYGNLYAAQAFHQAGGEYWERYYPGVRDHLVREQRPDGHWENEQRGHEYATAVAILILRLPLGYLPIFQR
ncbi:MAG: hypothetical protein HY722_13445 [Planctomycetes bacterium]|nr:hypothetical protein [Planctomycetota bacterium]